MSAGEIIARQLAKAAFGWMGTARHLIGPSLCRSNAFRTGGLRASSASLFLFRRIRLMSFSHWICTFQAARGGLKKIPSCGRQRERAFYAVSCTGGLRASSVSLFLFRLIRLMSFSRWICTFQAAQGGLKMSPQCIGHGNGFFIRSFEKFF